MSNPDYYIYSTYGELFGTPTLENIFKNKFNPNNELKLQLPLSSSIDIKYYDSSTGDRKKLQALRNTLNYYSVNNPDYKFKEEYVSNAELTLISIPSIFFGSSIQKGSVELTLNYTGSVVAKLQDIDFNGSLKEVTGSHSGSVAGVVLYNHGFILLTGSLEHESNLKWCQYGTSSEEEINDKVNYDLKFNGTSYIPTLTMLTHAEKGELNHSNNPTYVKYSDSVKYSVSSGSNFYKEPEYLEIKNITKYPYDNFTGSLEKQTYISKIGIYDEHKNLIGVAKLAKPVRKTESRDFTFKLKLDI